MDTIEVVFGTYENLILGYKVVCNLDGSYSLETSFTDDSHRGALRCLSVSRSGMLASSSTDDSIRLHSLSKRKEIGGLFEHNGTVNSLTFYKGSHMFSASEDGTICMWKAKNWEMLRTLKGHKSHVMAVAIHLSGKLGLSVGSDKSFLTWDLVTGKLAFQRKVKEVAQNILFTSEGDHYVLIYNKKIEVCFLEDTKTVREIPTEWRINAVCFVEDNVLAIGGDDQMVLLIDVLTGKQLLTLDMAKPEDGSFSSRVKCICVLDCEESKLMLVVTANGNLKVFRVNLEKKEAKMLLFYETRVRVTCMTVYTPATDLQSKGAIQSKTKKPKQAEETATVEPPKKKKMAMDFAEQVTSDEEEEEEEEEDSNEDSDQKNGNVDVRNQGSQKKGKKRKLDGKSPKQLKGKKQKFDRDDDDSLDDEAEVELQIKKAVKQRNVNQQRKKKQKKNLVNKKIKKTGAEGKKSMKASSKQMKMKKKKKRTAVK